MDNQALQSDEVEALSAIYGNDWTLEDELNRVYSITLKEEVKDDTDHGNDHQNNECPKTITLQIRLPSEYPLDAPPFYTLSAPWMSRKDKAKLMSSLDDIYCQHSGESIIYIWVEKAREYLVPEKEDEEASQGKAESDNSGGQNDEQQDENQVLYNHQKHHHHHHSNGDHSNSDGLAFHVYSGEPIIDRRSTFQAHLAPVDCLEQVKEALSILKTNKKYESATHNISAYRISGGPHNTCVQDCDDDGETHAGSRLLHLLQILDVKDVLVVVSRWYGGIQLGPDRFKHINNVARDLLDKSGFLENHSHEDVAQSGRKKRSK